MSDWNTLRAALRTRLLTVASLPANRAWENRGANPPKGAVYVEDAIIPASERALSYGQVEQIAIYQVTIVVPQNDGTKVGEDIIDDVLAAFPPAATLSGVVRVDRSERNPPRNDGATYRMPVSIRWRAYRTY